MNRTRTLVTAAALLLAAAPIPAASAAAPAIGRCSAATLATMPISEVSYDVGTGEQHGVRDAYTAPDGKWDVVAPTPGDAYSVAPNSAWVTVPDANWINSRTTNESSGGTVVSVDQTLPGVPAVDGGPTQVSVGLGTTQTTFRTQFTLDPHVVNRTLEIDYAADNGVRFLLNGTTIGGYDPLVTASNADQVAAFHQLHTLVFGGLAFQDGVNTLDAVVSDYGVATGLLVRGAVHGCAVRDLDPSTCVDVRRTDGSVIAYSPAPVDVSTGSTDGVPDPVPSTDGKWHTGPLAAGSAVSVTPHSGWWSGSTRANWVSVDQGYGPGTPGAYVYSVSVDLGPDVAYGGIVLSYAADNAVAFRLNGTPIGGYAAGDVKTAFNQPHTISLASAPLRPGVNTLEATVTDYGTATGLLVEGDVYVCRGGVRA
jgi:hypothetical protein